jgi:IS30 family transposase
MAAPVEHPADSSVTSDRAHISISSQGARRVGRTFPVSDLTQGDLSHTRPSRAVLSLTEGDLIIGRKNLSAIGTLVERTTNYTMLLHLPDGYTPELVRDALAAKIKTLPEILRASLTWDQGPEMGKWKQVSVDADIDIFFCDPHAPWQRATNENTNGLLRQYFPKSSDLSAHSADDLDWVAAELNDRPRKRLGFKKPIEQIGPLLLR